MIFIYDNALTQLGVISNFKSLDFLSQLRGVGKFSLTIDANKSNVEYLVKGNIINIDDTCGIIVSRKLRQDASGKKLVIKGTGLLGLLTQRIIATMVLGTYATETHAKSLVNCNCGTTAAADRKFANFTVATNGSNGTSQYAKDLAKPLLSVCERILALDDYGHKIYINGSNLTYDVIVPVDRTASVQFSENIQNVKVLEHTSSNSNYKNVAYIEGDGVWNEVGTDTGYSRREVSLKYSGISVEADLIDPATSDLKKKYQQTENIAFVARISGNPFVYKTHYDLGDEVTVVSDGVAYEVQITEVREIYSSIGREIYLTVGTPERYLSEQIKDIKESE